MPTPLREEPGSIPCEEVWRRGFRDNRPSGNLAQTAYVPRADPGTMEQVLSNSTETMCEVFCHELRGVGVMSPQTKGPSLKRP
jgi:hypothetical protein